MTELEFVEPTVELISINCEDIVFSSPGASVVYCAVNGTIYETIEDYCAATANDYVPGEDMDSDW